MSTPIQAVTLLQAVKAGNFMQVEKVLENDGLSTGIESGDYDLLMHALKNKHKDIALLLLNYGCGVKKINKMDNSESHLYYAVELNDIEVIKELLSKGASVDEQSSTGETILSLAFKKRNFEIVDLLLEYYDKTTSIDSLTNRDTNYFNIACLRNNVGLVQKFLQNGMNVDDFKCEECPGYSILHCSVSNLYVDLTKLLVKYNVNIYARSPQGFTPLQLIFNEWFSKRKSLLDSHTQSHKYEEIMDCILAAHTSQIIMEGENPENEKNISHFHIACTREDPKIVEKFLQNGINVNSTVSGKNCSLTGDTALHLAVKYNRFEIAKILLKYKIDVHTETVDGKTSFHLAWENGAKEIIMLLLRHGARPIFINNESLLHRVFESKHKANVILINDETLLQCASESSTYYDIVGSILSKHDVENGNPTSESGISYFHIACTQDDVNIIKKFLNSKIDINISVSLNSKIWAGYTALHFAAAFNKTDMVELLLQKGADTTIKEAHGWTALSLACQLHYNKIGRLLEKTVHCLKEILAGGSEIEDWEGDQKNQLRIIELLLEHKSDVNTRDKYDQTVLFLAIKLNIGSIMQAFNENIFISYDESLMKTFLSRELGSRRLNILKLLLSYGADINAFSRNKTVLLALVSQKNDIKQSQFEAVKLLLSRGANPNYQTKDDSVSALNFAVRNRNVELAEELLNHQAEVNGITKQNKTALHFATDFRYFSIDMVKLLVDNGANVDVPDIAGNTPLHNVVTHFSMIDGLHLLLQTFSNVNAQNKKGQTSLFRAVLRNNWLAVHVLIENGADMNITDEQNEHVLCHIHDLEIKWSLRYGTRNYFQQTFMVLDFNIRRLKLIGFSLNEFEENTREYLKSFYAMKNLEKDNSCDIYNENNYMVFDENDEEYDELFEESENSSNYEEDFDEVELEDTSNEEDENMPIENDCTIDKPKRVKLKDVSRKTDEHSIDGPEEVELENMFIDELNIMKAIKLGGNLLLYDIIFANPQEMTLHTKNEALIKLVESHEFEDSFKFYGFIIKLRMKEGITRINLLNQTRQLLKECGFVFPNQFYNKILVSLNNNELSGLIK